MLQASCMLSLKYTHPKVQTSPSLKCFFTSREMKMTNLCEHFWRPHVRAEGNFSGGISSLLHSQVADCRPTMLFVFHNQAVQVVPKNLTTQVRLSLFFRVGHGTHHACRTAKMLTFLSWLVSLLIVYASIWLIHFDTSHFVLNDILSWRDNTCFV